MSKKTKPDVNWEDNSTDEKSGLTDSVKEVLSTLLKTAPRLKEEVTKRLGDEIMKLVSKVDLVAEAKKFLESHKVIVKAEFEFKKKEESND